VSSATPAASPPSSALPESPIEVRATVLWQDYQDNEAKGDAKYKGKTLQLADSVKVRKDGDAYYLGFETVGSTVVTTAQYKLLTPQQKKWYNEGYPPNVLCYLDSASVSKAAQLSERDICTVRGVCAGRKNDPDVYLGYVVVLKNCQIVDVSKTAKPPQEPVAKSSTEQIKKAIAQLNSPEAEIRAQGIQALATPDAKDAVPALIEVCRTDVSAKNRYEAVKSIGAIGRAGGERGFQFLLGIVLGGQGEGKLYEQPKEYGGPDVIEPGGPASRALPIIAVGRRLELQPIFLPEDVIRQRDLATVALGKWQDRRAVEVLAQILEFKEAAAKNVRGTVPAKLGYWEPLAPLESAELRTSIDSNDSALRALDDSGITPKDTKAVEVLTRLTKWKGLGDDSEKLRVRCDTILRKMKAAAK
jgi:hypothetical protein